MGFTVPRVDSVLAPYAEKSFEMYKKEYMEIIKENQKKAVVTLENGSEIELLAPCGKESEEYARKKVKRDFEQGWQGLEYKLNSVGSSRGDYIFVAITLGLDTTEFGKMAAITYLDVHRKGQGKDGFKKVTLFPKSIFLYDENLHGEGCVNEDVFEAGIKCSQSSLYPDWLSLTGEGYVPEMYKKYGTPVHPMGCRSFTSPWYERGGMEPADENDKPVFEGRWNGGVVSLNLMMILQKSRQENKDFYEVLDYYLELIRKLHMRTYNYLGEMKASTNPLAYCEGGFYGGHLKPDEKIKSILKPMTMSFGFTGLNELQELYNGKSLVEDGKFALEVLKYISEKVEELKNQKVELEQAKQDKESQSQLVSNNNVTNKYIKKIKEEL